MSEIPPLRISIQADTKDITASLKETNTRIKEFGDTVKQQTSFMEKFKASAAGMFAADMAQKGLAMLKNQVGAVIADAEAYERALAKINQQLTNTGGVSGKTTEEIKKQASSLESLTAVNENLILQSQSVLLSMTNIRNQMGENNDIFDRATKAALDLSTVMEGDLQGATVAVGKALNNPIAGLTRLQKVGVQFTEDQVKLVKQLMATGDVMGAQKVILDQLEKTYGGTAAAAGDTFAGAVERAKDKVQDFARDIVLQAQPAILNMGKALGDIVTNYIAPFVTILIENKEAILAFVGVLVAAKTALLVYKGTLIAVKVTQEAFTVVTTLMKGAQLASIASTNGLAASMLALNAAMRANLIGIIVTGVAALAALLVVAWKNSQTFRNIVVEGAQLVLGWWKKLLTGFADLLRVLSKIPGMGWAKGLADGADKLASKLGVVIDKLDQIKYKTGAIGNFQMSTGTVLSGTYKPSTTTPYTIPSGTDAKKKAEDEKKALEALKKDAAEITKAMSAVQLEALDKAGKAAKVRDKAIAAANKRAQEAIAAAEKKAAKERAEAQEAYDDAIDAAKDRREKAEKAARKRNADALIKIAQDYSRREKDILEAKNDAIDNAQKKADEKRIQAERNAAEKRLSIIQQSIDRLRNAFAAKTGFDLAESFKEGGSVEKLLSDLKTKLTGARDLQANAAALAGRGYSQVFIEEVVKNGPEAGNAIAKALLDASPEATAEMQRLYKDLDDVSAHGLDQLAKQMNAGANLATEQLREAYAQVTIDLKDSLAEINKELTEQLTEANKNYDTAMTEAARTRDEAITEASKDLKDALAEALEAYNDDVAQATKTLTRTLKKIDTELAETLEEIAKDLADNLAEAQEAYQEAIDQINEETKKKLDELQAKLEEVAAAMLALGKAAAAAAALAAAPTFNPIGGAYSPTARAVPADGSVASWRAGEEASWARYNITQNFNNLTTSAYDVNNATVAGIRYGTAITTGTSLRAIGRD